MLPGHGLARLFHGGVSLGGVLGVLGGAQCVEHRFRDNGGYPLAINSEMGDDATLSQVNRLLDGRADWKIVGGLAHTDKCRVSLCAA